MHRSHHPVDITLVVDDDNNGDVSSHQYIPSTTCDYSSLIIDSPTDTMYHHRTRSPSPSPTSPMSTNNHHQGPQPTTSSPSTTTSSARHSHRRSARSASLVDLNASGTNLHRLRFNTWPRHRKEKRDILAEHDKRLAKSIIQELGIGINKTYRNPWGNLSYAQLITRAIDSSPWKRLTLNEVYEWIIKFVPYFKDKIDAKTSWGWKNSIRHNLSLHNQFIRVPIISSLSKGPVKYVWTINPSFKNNSPYKKYSLKRKRAAAAAALASQAAAAAAVSNINSISSSTGLSGLSLSQEQNSPSSTSSQPLVNMSNNYHRQSSTSLPKATRLNEHAQGNNSSTLNQLSMAAAMMSAGITDPAAYRAFLNSQAAAAAMLNKHKQQTLSASSTQPSTSMGNRPTQSNSSSFAHESGLPVPKKVALGNDRYKQQQEQQQQQQHAEWLLNSYRQQQQQQQQQSAYNNGRRPPHPSESTKMMVNQQRSSYLPPPPPTSSTRVNTDLNNLSPSLQRRVSSPASYSSAAVVTAQNKLLAQTKLWHAAVQAAAHAQQQQQQQYHHSQQQQSSANTFNELQSYINRPNTSNGNHNKMSTYFNSETLKLLSLSSSSTTATGNNSHDEQHMCSNASRYKMMRSSYPNATAGSLPPPYLIRQPINQTNSSTLTSQQQMEMVTAAYQNYRRRSSGFSSTTSHGGASDDESDEHVPPRKDSSTSNASSGYESGLAVNRQSPPTIQSIRTGSGSSLTSEASSSSCYHNNQNGRKLSAKRLTKIIPSENDIEMDDRQPLSLNSVGGYVDDLMERIRKMPPKKRSKFYQMLDEERIKDVNNNNSDDPQKSKINEVDDDDHLSMDVSMPLLISEVHSDGDDDDERTLSELTPHRETKTLDKHLINEERKDQAKEPFFSLNEKSFEELHAMGVPIAVLKAIAYQQSQARKTNNSNTNLLANYLSTKYSIPSTNSSSDTKTFLNARTILRRILQQHQKEQKQRSSNEKTVVESMDYTTDEEGDTIDDDEHQSSLRTPHHRNGVRSNSHNPGAGTLNPNDIASLSPPTSTSSSPDETDVHHQSSPNSLSRPSSTPATIVSSACSF